MRKIDEIVIHATAYRPDWMEGRSIEDKIAVIREDHKHSRKWKDIAYHYLIDRDGTVGKGRKDSVIGAHTKGNNSHTLGVALMGGYQAKADDVFEDHFTEAQNRALRKLLGTLIDKYDIEGISGHNEYANKGCPGFNVRKWMEERKKRATVMELTTLKGAGVGGLSGAATLVTAISQLEGPAQWVLIGLGVLVICAVMYIGRERIRHYIEGAK